MKIEPLRIQDIRFTARETASLYVLAGQALKDQGIPRKEALEKIRSMTPQNLLRLALGFEQRQRGGPRANAGRPKETKEQKPKEAVCKQ